MVVDGIELDGQLFGVQIVRIVPPLELVQDVATEVWEINLLNSKIWS